MDYIYYIYLKFQYYVLLITMINIVFEQIKH